jgi:hypothetical protein
VCLALTACLSGSPGEADPKWGPFRGRFVDADTGEPIPGAVAYAIWLRNVPGLVHGTQRFEDVRFAVSDAAGEFVIPARPRPALFAGGVDGPFFDFVASRYQLVNVDDRHDHIASLRHVSRVPASERRAIRGLGNHNLIPSERVRALLEEVNTVRARMTLPPFETLGGQP